MVKACEDWGINHLLCIGHSLHVVVGPFIVILKGRKQTSQNENEEQAYADEDDVVAMVKDEDDASDDGLSDCFDSTYASEHVILEVRQIVQEMQKFCSFVKNSTKCIEKLKTLQKKFSDAEATILKVKMDERTQWN